MNQCFTAFLKDKFCVNNGIKAKEILMQIRASKKIQNEVSLQDPIGVDKEGNEITLIDLISNDSE